VSWGLASASRGCVPDAEDIGRYETVVLVVSVLTANDGWDFIAQYRSGYHQILIIGEFV
jgi:hypothetical protein